MTHPDDHAVLGAPPVAAPPVALVVPVKSFHAAKGRLAPVLTPAERASLSRCTAARVLAAAGAAARFVVCDDPEVAEWATDQHATVVWRPGHGLNAAVADGVRAAGETGAASVVVAHADLPLAWGLDQIARPDAAVLVPDRVEDGTNVIALPASMAECFRFRYGPGSFGRHRRAAESLGLAVTVVHDDRLALDIDTPDDLAHPALAGLADAVRAARGGHVTWEPPTSPASRPS